jgi:hypothetical protein
MASAGQVLLRGQIPDLFESRLPYIDEILFMNFDAPSLTYPEVFNVRNSDRYAEEMTEITGYAQFAVKPEGQPIEADKMLQGFDKRLKHDTWGKLAEISFESMEDDMDGAITDIIPAFADVARNSIETEIFSTYNNAFGTATTADGLSLINSAHLIVGGGTFDNSVSGDLAQGTLESAVNKFADMRNGRNQFVGVEARKLLVHVDQRWLVHELLRSQLRSDTAENASNALTQIGLQPVFTRYLTDTDAFYVLADPSKIRVMTYWRRQPFTDSSLDFVTRNMRTAMLYRMSHGAIDWRGVVGSTGA